MLFPEAVSKTPCKRIKLNEESTLQNSRGDKLIKPSFLFRLKTGELGNKGSNSNVHKIEVTQFQLPFDSQSSKDSDYMEQQDMVEEIQMKKLMLSKKLTYVHRQMNDYNMDALNLYRNNSTFQPAPQTQQQKLGDNVYLREITISQKKINPNKIQEEDESLRIQQDYQIQQNLHLHNRNHENYICLNKLQRIFYYVKKIKMDWNHENYQFLQELAENQIKIYTHDPSGHFIRYYQSWFEHNALYLTYEVSVESIEECNRISKKLRQVQVWNLLRDCCSALDWLYQSQGEHHLNLKPGNIIKCHQKFKLSDPFSTTKILQHYIKQESNWRGYHYLAPEIKQYYPLIEGLDLRRSDIYSLGICIIENLLGENHLPKQAKNVRQYIQKHLHGYSPSLVKTLSKMVSMNPANRPKAQDITSFGGRAGKPLQQQKARRFSI